MSDERIRAVAERRLEKICNALGLRQDHFRYAEQAALQSFDGQSERILSEDVRRATDALAQISDQLLRARLVQLIVAIAEPVERPCLEPDGFSDQIPHQ